MSFEVKRKVFSGIVLSLFLVTMVFSAIPVPVSAQFTGNPVYIGLVGPKGWVQWDGIKEGADLARGLINDAGGMVGSDGKTHEVLFVEIDEHAVPIPSPMDGVTELLAALDAYPTMQFLVGGFVYECVLPMREAAVDYAAVHGRPIWIIAGAATDELIDDGPDKDNPYDDVREDYDRYKYMFRASPVNTTTLLNTLVAFLKDHVLPQELAPIYGSPVKTYIVAEDLVWCDRMVASLQGGALGTQAEIVGVARPSPVDMGLDFTPVFESIEAAEARLVVHLFSAAAGEKFIWQWGERKVSAVPVGINFESGLRPVYPMETGWKCEYETTLCAGTRTNINPDAKPLSTEAFWDEYLTRYGHTPIYTAWGAYDAIIALNETASQWMGKTCDEMIPIFEATVRNGILGWFKYTGPNGMYHDVYSAVDCLLPIWPSGTVRPLAVQWQAGRMEVVWPRDQPYSRKWKIPVWMYSHAESDFAGVTIYSWCVPVSDVPGVSPDGLVDMADVGLLAYYWQRTPPWWALEVDMQPQNHFVNIYDVAKVAKDFGYDATVEYGQWPLP